MMTSQMNGPSRPLFTSPARKIGSFFAAMDEKHLTKDPQPLPWEDDGVSPEYVETGRQALNAIVRDLVARGIRDVFLPGYLCDSVLDPFLLYPLNLRFLPTTRELQMDLRALGRLERPTSAERSAVLMVRYFGHVRDDEYVGQMARLQNLGFIVVEDLTHSLFDLANSTADYTFASLRKLLPVASGAMLTGLDYDRMQILQRSDPTDALWFHMDSKKQHLEGTGASNNYYEGLISASELLASTLEAHRIDQRSYELLPYLPYDSFIQSRRNNFAALGAHLDSIAGIDMVNKENQCAPTHLILRTADSIGVQQKLTERGVYCPVHWPRPLGLPRGIPWKDGHFSVPIDHRYNIDDMIYVASSVREILS